MKKVLLLAAILGWFLAGCNGIGLTLMAILIAELLSDGETLSLGGTIQYLGVPMGLMLLGIGLIALGKRRHRVDLAATQTPTEDKREYTYWRRGE